MNIKIIAILSLVAFFCSSCGKFLDAKSDKKLAVPVTLDDLQSILNYQNTFDKSAEELEIPSGDFDLTDEDLDMLSCETTWDLYLWQDGPHVSRCEGDMGWEKAYKQVYNANAVMEGVMKYLKSNPPNTQANNILGQAYYQRATAFLELTGVYTEAYEEQKAASMLGIPLRLSSDFNIKTVRSNLAETYQQVLADFQRAAQLLPVQQPIARWANKAGIYGYMARTSLMMNRFADARKYADTCLSYQNTLVDYNTLDLDAKYPFAKIAPGQEMLNYRTIYSYLFSLANIDPNLIASYPEHDLRKKGFFKEAANGRLNFKGAYGTSTSSVLFSGVTVAEVLLIRAECSARLADIPSSLQDLNHLLKNRMHQDHYVPFASTNQNDVLAEVLKQRRLELVMRGIRYPDVKRLNALGAQITLERVSKGQLYTLEAQSPKGAILIPEDIVQLSGIQQNRR